MPSDDAIDIAMRLLKQGFDLAPPMTRGAGEEMMPVQDDVPMVDVSMGGETPCECAERVRTMVIQELNDKIKELQSLPRDRAVHESGMWAFEIINHCKDTIRDWESVDCETVLDWIEDMPEPYAHMCQDNIGFSESDQMMYMGEPMDIAMRLLKQSEDNPLLQYLTPELLGGINESGGTMYQTGGSLRDSYIGGLDSKDLDLLVHGMDKEDLGDLLQQHGDVDFVGAQHGVFKFRPHGMEGEPFDVGVPRREISTGEGHSDYEMSFDKDMPLEDEQLRRDFWMNAMMRNIHTGELHDIDGRGLQDIKNQQISVVNPKAFSEDPLRMLRAVQFASRFGFNIEPETLKHIQDSAHKINTVHPERFNAEFLKLFEKSKRPSDGVDLLHQTGITNHILHDAQSTEIMNHIPKSAYGAFLAEMAQNYGDDAKEYLQSALNISNKDAISAQAVIDWKNNQPLNNNWDVVQFYNEIRGDPHIIHNIDAHSHASETVPLSSQLDYIREQGIPTNLKELNVNGKDLMNLGYRGVEIGNSLNELFKYAVQNQTNDKEHLLSLASDKLQKSTHPLYGWLTSANTMKPFDLAMRLLKRQTELGEFHEDFPSSHGPVTEYHGTIDLPSVLEQGLEGKVMARHRAVKPPAEMEGQPVVYTTDDPDAAKRWAESRGRNLKVPSGKVGVIGVRGSNLPSVEQSDPHSQFRGTTRVRTPNIPRENITPFE